MNRRLEMWLLIIVGGLMAAGVVGIGLYLPVKESPKATYLIELGKILAAGLIVGILGVWAKQVFERVALNKQELVLRAAARKELFETLEMGARKALRLIRDPNYDAARSFSILFAVKGSDFEALLVRWKELEPDAANLVLSSYIKLESAFNKQYLSQEFRDIAKPEIQGWAKQFSSRIMGG